MKRNNDKILAQESIDDRDYKQTANQAIQLYQNMKRDFYTREPIIPYNIFTDIKQYFCKTRQSKSMEKILERGVYDRT